MKITMSLDQRMMNVVGKVEMPRDVILMDVLSAHSVSEVVSACAGC